MTATRMRFADPTTCPACRATLPVDPERCPSCDLPLQGPVARQLLTTLAWADTLLDQLRATAPTPPPRPGPPIAEYVPQSTPPPTSPATQRTGVRTTSVPKILLGLGATCLLVAAVIFLAVAWSWLGIGGRTAVLISFTAGSLGLGTWLGRRRLRIAAEALTSVALGLLILDVIGAEDAGWLGEMSLSGLVTVVGGVLTATATALTLPSRRLVVPQLAAPFGLLLLLSGIAAQTGHLQVLWGIGVLTFTLLHVLGRERGATVLPWTAGVGAALSWSFLGLLALGEALDHMTVPELWLDGQGWGLVAGAVLALIPWALRPSSDLVRQGCVAFAASTLTFVVALPGLDEGLTQATYIAVVATIVWAVVAAAAPKRWYAAPRIPLAGSAAVLAGVAAVLAMHALGTLTWVGEPFSQPAGVGLVPGDLPASPMLLLVSVLVLGIAALLALPRSSGMWWLVGVSVGAAGLGTLALLGVPLWTVVGILLLVAVALTFDALRRIDIRGGVEAGAALVLLVVAAATALPSAVLETVVLGVLVAKATAMLLRGRFAGAAEGAGTVLPLAAAGFIWSAGEVLGTDPAFRAVPILGVVGALALMRPRIEVELAAAFAALMATAVAVPLASDASVSLAIHLTLAGALVTATSLLHPTRRPLGWLGGFLLASATWVRLADLGVEAPEAYTLPSAVALLVVGLFHLRTHPDASTMTALAPGLALATVPSLLWVLADPVTTRAAVLGIACLALVLVGTSLQWNAPVLVGSVVGSTLVLRELVPYAAATPQWVLIGLAGTLLIVVGVTWESRMRDLQHAAAYLGRLR